MSRTSGILVEYTNKEGKIQKAVMYHKDHSEQIQKAGKALLYLLNENLTPKFENRKEVTAMKSKSELKKQMIYRLKMKSKI